MKKDTFISDSIVYIGVDDKTIDLFESQYKVPKGVSYNSYIIFDDKIAIMDTVDKRASKEWLENVEKALAGKKPDYLIISHMEPDHGANIMNLCEKYPEITPVINTKTKTMLPQFFESDISSRALIVNEGESLSLGNHTLKFFMAPMVHWPEVMVTYEEKEKILFSADAFGKFGALDEDEEWTDEARRYYINIVGKYGAQVQALLKKASALDIKTICPLHGPILKENLGFYINKYDIWSKYEPEEDAALIAYGSIHGNTGFAAEKMSEILESKGFKNVSICDLSRSDLHECIARAYACSRLIVASATYDAGLFPVVEDFIAHLKSKNFQNRKIGIIENGSWAPMAAKKIKEAFEGMKNISIAPTVVSIRSAVKAKDIEAMEKLADEIL